MTFLDFIIPCYNISAYIATCLDSIQRQDVSRSQLEVITVDDGSIDNTGSILDEYALKNNLLVTHKGNAGVSAARNTALSLAIGMYVWFVDGDDFIETNICNEIIYKLNKENCPDILQIIMAGFIDGENLNNIFMDLDFWKRKNATWLQGNIVKNDIIRNSRLVFDCRLSCVEDDVFLNLLYRFACSNAHLVDRIAYYYRQRNGSALHSSITDYNIGKTLLTYRTLLDYAEKYGFFSYFNSLVLRRLPNVMCFIANKPLSEQKKLLANLKNLNLYPLQLKGIPKSEKNKHIGLLKRIRGKSYTRTGFFLLRTYYLYRKLVEKCLS